MYKYKTVLLGKENIGKSSLLVRLLKNEYNEYIDTTIGASFATYEPFNYKGIAHLELWDTAGQERYRSLVPMYYKHASIAIIVYDILNIASYDIAKGWVTQIKNDCPTVKVIALVANKVDLNEDRVVYFKDAVQYATQNNLLYFEVSAKNGYNVYSMFNILFEKIHKITLEEVKKSTLSIYEDDDDFNEINLNSPIQSSTYCCYYV
jgi:Ras-related protein Rab-5C